MKKIKKNAEKSKNFAAGKGNWSPDQNEERKKFGPGFI